MVLPARCCPYCQQAFQPSPRRPDQVVCSRPECQARRRNEYRRRKRQSDPEYAEVVRDSRRKWRDAHPDYQKKYWQNHPEYAQVVRDSRRKGRTPIPIIRRSIGKTTSRPRPAIASSSVNGIRSGASASL